MTFYATLLTICISMNRPAEGPWPQSGVAGNEHCNPQCSISASRRMLILESKSVP